jgi:hypothetical protein
MGAYEYAGPGIGGTIGERGSRYESTGSGRGDVSGAKDGKRVMVDGGEPKFGCAPLIPFSVE